MAYSSELYSTAVEFHLLVIDDSEEGTRSAEENLKKVEKQADATTNSLKQIAIAFGALTAVSMTAVVASDRVQTLEKASARSALTFGVQKREMYEYVQGLSSASDSQEEIAKTMDILSKSGAKWGTQLTEIYHYIDDIADAVGETSDQVANELIPTFEALGIPIDQIEKFSDAFVYAAVKTKMSLGDMSYYVMRYAGYLKEYGMDLNDTIALFGTFAQKGVQGRMMMQLMSAAFKDMDAGAEAIAKGEKELITIQEKLSAVQKDAASNAREYWEDMRLAGGNVAKQRELTLAFNRQQRSVNEKKTEIEGEKKAVEIKIDTAKTAPKISFQQAIAKESMGRISEEDITRLKTALTGPEAKGATEKYSTVGDLTTATQDATYKMDQAMQNTLGKTVGKDVAEGLIYLSAISGTIATISGILAIIQGFSATTAVATTVSAGASAGGNSAGLIQGILGMSAGAAATGVIGGAALGALGVYAMEKTGVTSLGEDFEQARTGTNKKPTGMIENAGRDFRGTMTGEYNDEKERQYLAQYLNDHNGQYPPNYEPVPGATHGEMRRKEETLNEYDEGGVVPGQIGEPQQAIVHGGEIIIPPKFPIKGFGDYGDAGSDLPSLIADAVAKAVSGIQGFSITIQNMNVSKDYPADRALGDLEKSMRDRRQQQGVRTL